MAVDTGQNVGLEIGHVLFIDIVGYSKRLVNEQSGLVKRLNNLVRSTEQFRRAESDSKLITIPTGDGMALVFFTTPDAPVRCAIELNQLDREDPKIELRMGIHSGPVDRVADVNQRMNVAGAGINMAQRVMDCGDAGHILLSKRSADDLTQYDEWKRQLHDLGEMEAKHGVRVGVVNLYNDDFGNPARPEKLKRADQAQRVALIAQKRRKRRRIVASAAALILLIGGVAAGTWAWHRRVALASGYKAGITPLVEKSIAVLPFENFETDKQSAYFADGVQDDILTDLAKVADLKVISRRSVAQYRGSTQNIRDIGQALQVAYVLEGTVRKFGGKIRVTAQLIDTRTDLEKWAEKYERDVADLFALQNEISETIVAQLRATISPAEKSAIEKTPTHDMEAYDMYLQARAIVYAVGVRPKVADETRPKAQKLLEDAIARDPKFVLAYCLLSEIQGTPNWAEELTPEQIARAKTTAEMAVRLAPESGEAHLALGNIYYGPLNDRARGVEELAIAARTMPNSPDVLTALGDVARDRGQWKEARRNLEKAAQLDPHNADIALDLIFFYTDLRHYREAELLADRLIASLPPASTMQFWAAKSDVAMKRGNLRAARSALEASPNHNTGSTSHNHRLAQILLRERRYAEAAALIDQIPELARKGNVLPRSGINPFARGAYAQTLGIALRAAGQTDKARAAFEVSRTEFSKWLLQRPEEAEALGMMAVADAGCGRNAEAVREAQRAMEVWPPSREPLLSAEVKAHAAVVYAWTGDKEAALRILTEVAGLPGGVNPGDLKLNPKWDDLRSDSRFGEILTEAAKPVSID